MSNSFKIKDAISGRIMDMEPASYEDALWTLNSIRHHTNTDYFLFEIVIDPDTIEQVAS